MWGIYPATVPEAGTKITGTFCTVDSHEHLFHLQEYETGNYTAFDIRNAEISSKIARHSVGLEIRRVRNWKMAHSIVRGNKNISSHLWSGQDLRSSEPRSLGRCHWLGTALGHAIRLSTALLFPRINGL